MALHNTQCPHCFTTYVISDAQMRVSEGMVRCGTCRERFQARIIEPGETPKFDPREAFIEPISDDAETATKHSVSIIEDAITPKDIVFVEPKTNIDKNSENDTHAASNPDVNSHSMSASVLPDVSSNMGNEAPQKTPNAANLSADEMLANIKARQEREAKLAEQQELALPERSVNELPANKPAESPNDVLPAAVPNTESEKAPSQLHSRPTFSIGSEAHDPGSQEPENLIDQVDLLVDNKLLNTANAPLILDSKPTGKSRAWLYAPPLLLIIAGLIAILAYQLWLKQIVNLSPGSVAQEKLIELTLPLARELEGHDIELPVRRNLSQMELLSARTEPHPTRPSTTLLRVSIINRADISQPLPWLELSLSDADGRLVSRRNLSPNDYLYNNNTINQIGPSELKKVTIELLSFPKQATGYELKLLNR